jgi:hypothetical protein
MLRQLAKDQAQRSRDLGSFCEQFCLPSCSPKSRKQCKPKPKDSFRPKSRFSRYKKSKPTSNKSKPKIVAKKSTPSTSTGKCYRCGKPRYIARYCKFSKKVKTLNLDDSILSQIEHLLIEESDSDITDNEVEQSEQQFNQLEDDDLDSFSTSDSDRESQPEINVLTKERDLLLKLISNLSDTDQKKKIP